MRKNNRSQLVLRLLLSVSLAGIVPLPVTARVLQSGQWSLQVIKPSVVWDQSPAEVIWFGLTNRSRVARLICVAGWGYHTSLTAAAETSTHACDSIEGFQIVLPGETQYSPARLPLAPVSMSTTLEVSVTMTQYDISVKKNQPPQEVKWRGTLLAAAEAGRKLLGR
jgi:hypothetical protein